VADARADDGRPCEATLAAFEAASPGFISLGNTRYRAGTASVPGVVLKRAGNLRVCAYLYVISTQTLARDEHVVTVRLPTGTATLAVTPARPLFGRPTALRVTGAVDIPARVDVLASAGACSEGESAVTPRSVPAGPFDVTFTDVDLPDDLARLCLRVTPDDPLDPPNDALVLASVEQSASVDLGAALTDLRVRVVGRRIEVSAAVSGLRGPLRLRMNGAYCGSVAVRAGRASAVCYVIYGSKLPASEPVVLVGTSRLGANVRSASVPVALAALRRAGRVVLPGRSIGVVRLGMSLGDLLRQGARPNNGVFTTRKLILPQSPRARVYEVDNVFAWVDRGKVRAIFTRGSTLPGAGDFRTARGLTTHSSALRSALRRLAPGSRCRTLPANHAFTDLCQIGRSTWWGPKGGGAIGGGGGFLAIWPGARVR
jgi:hypothetical protein